MEAHPVALVVISGVVAVGFVWLLGKLFEAAIKPFNFVGSLIVAGIAAAVSVYFSSVIFDISTAQAAVQFVGTQTVLAGIGMGMFATSEDNP